MLPKDLHITRKACALVAISNGEVIKTGKPKVHRCPLFTTLFSHSTLDRESIEDKFKKQVSEWGMFTCRRNVCDEKIIVPFGASEMIMYALKRNTVDSAVVACEGAGTVITSNPGTVQGIGAYMNGLFFTTPVPGIIKKIKDNSGIVLSEKDAILDQFLGVKKAIELGHKRIVVTVRGDEKDKIKKIRSLDKNNIKNQNTDGLLPGKKGSTDKTSNNLEIIILAICNTGITKKQAEVVRDNADLAWACASKEIREIAGPKAILQVGMKIPVFVLTKPGLNFISAYSINTDLKEKLKNIEKKHYITSNKFYDGSVKMSMGKFSVFLYETEKLPVSTDDEPYPLI